MSANRLMNMVIVVIVVCILGTACFAAVARSSARTDHREGGINTTLQTTAALALSDVNE